MKKNNETTNNDESNLNYKIIQGRIDHSYQKLSSVLKTTQDHLSSIEPQHNESSKYIESFKSILTHSIKEAEDRINEVRTHMVWDRLVVAFFGSTNAGKSTIIETLRIKYQKDKSGKDGDIVGDGSPDFTQTFDEYNINLGNIPITVVDMPGIEGNESSYAQKIRSALDKAHIIMYVYRDDTKPDSKIVEKIKYYLNDWVKVFSIYNVSGFACSPNEPLHSRLNEAESLIKQEFVNTLGETYLGNISLHAFAGLASVADFDSSKNSFIIKQNKLCNRFDSRDQLYSYSAMPKLEEFLIERGSHYIDEIVEANKTRLSALAKRTIDAISRAISSQEEILEQVPIELKKFRNDISRYFDDCISEIRNSSHLAVKNNLSSFQSSCFKLIDEKSKNIKKELEKEQEKYLSRIDQDVSEALNEKISDLYDNIRRRSNKLKNKINAIETGLSFNADDTYLNFNGVDGILNDVIDLDKGLDVLENAAKGAALVASLGAFVASLGSIGGPAGAVIGAAVGAILGIIKSIWDITDGKKYRQEAKDSIKEKISELKTCIIKSLDDALIDPINQLVNQQNNLGVQIEQEVLLINGTKQKMISVCDNIRNFLNQIRQEQYGQI